MFEPNTFPADIAPSPAADDVIATESSGSEVKIEIRTRPIASWLMPKYFEIFCRAVDYDICGFCKHYCEYYKHQQGD